jgi:hypothetical protein
MIADDRKVTLIEAVAEDMQRRLLLCVYFKDVLIDVNLVLTLVPSPFTAAMMTNAMPAAIKPYSIAVAPVSSARNLRKLFISHCRAQVLRPGESKQMKFIASPYRGEYEGGPLSPPASTTTPL